MTTKPLVYREGKTIVVRPLKKKLFLCVTSLTFIENFILEREINGIIMPVESAPIILPPFLQLTSITE